MQNNYSFSKIKKWYGVIRCFNSNFEHVATGLIPEIVLCIAIKSIQIINLYT